MHLRVPNDVSSVDPRASGRLHRLSHRVVAAFLVALPVFIAGGPVSYASAPAEWTTTPFPQTVAGSNGISVTALSSSSSTDAWAVGYVHYAGPDIINDEGQVVPSALAQTLAEHWSGSRWEVMTTPAFSPATYNALLAVSDVSTTDAWAVGYRTTHGGFQSGAAVTPLVENWNGRQWSVANLPPQVQPLWLSSVSATGSNNVWVAGYLAATASSSVTRSFTAHWNGNSWTTFSLAIPANIGTNVQVIPDGIYAPGGGSAWAIGQAANGLFVQRWSQGTWVALNVAQPPAPSGMNAFNNLSNSSLDAIGGVSASDVWVAGSYNAAPIAEYWDGRTWHLLSVPLSPGDSVGTVTAVACSGPTSVWLIGTQGTSPVTENAPLLVHWNGAALSVNNETLPSAKGDSIASLNAITASTGGVWLAGQATSGLTMYSYGSPSTTIRGAATLPGAVIPLGVVVIIAVPATAIALTRRKTPRSAGP